MSVTPVRPFSARELGELVAENPRVAMILERFGLDYCCHGHQTLAEAAEERGVAANDVVEAIAGAGEPTDAERQQNEFADLAALTRHIVDQHHQYVREATPVVRAWLDRLVTRHGSRHGELAEVRRAFFAVTDEMATHMMKEEHILFPYIDDLAAADRRGARAQGSPFGSVQNPIRVMEDDHQVVGDLVAEIRKLTSDYEPPADGCTTYRLCYAELARFEADLHRHVHLENNVLFPRAIELEAKLA